MCHDSQTQGARVASENVAEGARSHESARSCEKCLFYDKDFGITGKSRALKVTERSMRDGQVKKKF